MSGALRPHSNGWDENRKFKVLLKEGKLFFYRKKKKKQKNKNKMASLTRFWEMKLHLSLFVQLCFHAYKLNLASQISKRWFDGILLKKYEFVMHFLLLSPIRLSFFR